MFGALFAAIGVASTVAGTAMQYKGLSDADKYRRRAEAASKDAERIRQAQMELDATRRRREAVRKGLAQRALAESAAVNQNAQLGSGLEGGYGEIMGRTGFNVTGVTDNLYLGRDMFDANARRADAMSDVARSQTFANYGAGLTSLGNSFITNLPALDRVSQYLTQPRTPPQTSDPWGYRGTYDPRKGGTLY